MLKNYQQSTPLHVASEHGNLEFVKMLLENDKVDPNVKGS